MRYEAQDLLFSRKSNTDISFSPSLGTHANSEGAGLGL